jgi:hypothetical protein
MPRYEHRVDGRVVEAVIPEAGKHDDIHVYGARTLERQESGARDGWYLDGEWDEAEAAREAASDYESLTVEDLRGRLRALGMSTTGNKADLIKALNEAEFVDIDDTQEG